MLVLWFTLIVGLCCVVPMVETSNAELEELNSRLASIEANQQSARDSLLQLDEGHERDLVNATQSCQDLKSAVEEQGALLESIKQALQNRGGEICLNESDHHVHGNTGPCHPDNHTVIDDPRRAISGEYQGYDDMCDSDIQPGWYRFKLHGDSGKIPTECPPMNNCQTDAPTWVDLQGEDAPTAGQEVNVRACSHWNYDCCNWESPITVRNCGEFFVYKITQLDTCDLSFCVEEA